MGPALRHEFEEGVDYYAERADGLLASAKDGTAEAVAVFDRWGAPLTKPGARAVIAREHGFIAWAALCERGGALATGGEPFFGAFQAIRPQDLAALGEGSTGFPSWSRPAAPMAMTCSGSPRAPATSGWSRC